MLQRLHELPIDEASREILSDSLDGHLGEDEFSPLTIGGTEVSEAQTVGDAVATLVIGHSMFIVCTKNQNYRFVSN